jgi:hypothetical protein
MTKQMDMVCIPMSMGPNMKGNGWMTCKTVTELRHGQMVPSMKGVINKGKSMDKESISGQTDLNMKENGKIIK